MPAEITAVHYRTYLLAYDTAAGHIMTARAPRFSLTRACSPSWRSTVRPPKSTAS